MKALILAAGLGTRLRPVTDSIPKALVVVQGKTLLEHSLEHLKINGIREVIINVHHFPAMITGFLNDRGNFGMDVTISDESDLLLDTGGGLKKASWFFNDGEPFVVRNVDIISDIDLLKMKDFHDESGSVATLAVRDRSTSRYFLFDEQKTLSGWENKKTGERIVTRRVGVLKPLAFSGIQIVSPGLFDLITETGSFSLVPMYLRLSAFRKISGFHDDGSSWMDAGKPV